MSNDTPRKVAVELPSEEILKEVRERAADTSKPLSLHPLTPDQALLVLLKAGNPNKDKKKDET